MKKIPCPPKLDQQTGRALLEDVRKQKPSKGDAVVLDFSGTTEMDALGGAWVVAIADLLAGRKSEMRCEGQTGSVAEFIEMIEPGLLPPDRIRRKKEGILEEVGGRVFKYTNEFRDFWNLLIDALYWLCIAPVEGRGFRWGLWFDEMHEMGVRAVRINFLMNFLLGLIIAMLSAAQVAQYGLGIFVANLIVIGFARELAAIMTAIVVSARTGAAIAAELATMRVQEEIDALRGMGLNVAQFLVVPKILALLICMPCLTALGMIAGVLGGSVWGIAVLGFGSDNWMHQTITAVRFMDIFQGMLKSIAFALMIVMVGCHNGLRVTGGSRGVGLMTTRAVVMDIFFIIVIDIVFAAVFYYILDLPR
jgi:phospholipid/cholesterol/gamma-HCH transport system permease protein